MNRKTLQTRMRTLRQRGQGMTEYIIIVALIAIAAIGVYAAFGKVVRGQTGVIAAQLAGQNAGTSRTEATAGSTNATSAAQGNYTLGNYENASTVTTNNNNNNNGGATN